MKSILTFLFSLLATLNLFSQSNIQQPTSVNADGSNPAASAMLDVSAADKGMLVPRMTSAQRTAIASPATGLLVFDTTTGGFWFYNGAAWTSLSGGAGSSSFIADSDGNTKVQTEEMANEDVIRFDLGGTEQMVLRKNANGAARLELTDLTGNSFVGWEAGKNTNPSYLVSGYENTFLGYQAGFSNTVGYQNTATGNQSLLFNTEGIRNTANGWGALLYNTLGSDNTAIGWGTLYNNFIGDGNTASGGFAMYSNTVGYDNTAVGESAMYYNTTGKYNSVFGNQAFVNNENGDWNTALGYGAGYAGTANQQCTVIGANANVGTPTVSHTNAIAIGFDCYTTANNYARIGNTSVTSIGGQVAWSNYSDGRFKRNVQENVAGLDFITHLRPVTYQWDIHALNDFMPTTDDSTEWNSRYDIEEIRFSGFIAQEVEQAAYSVGYEFSGVDKPQNEFTPYGLRYAEFVVPLVKGMQEQQAIIERQQAEIDAQKTENVALKSRLDAQTIQLEKISAALAGAGIAVEK